MAAETLTPGYEVTSLSLAACPLEPCESEALLLYDEVSSTPLTEEELASRKFPVDKIGFPLPIYVPDEYRSNDYGRDEHHYWAPRKTMLRKHGELVKMLRHSRTQYVPIDLHRLFTKSFEKTPLTPNRVNRLGHLLLSLARYIPDEAIDVRPSIPERRELTLEERQTMWENDEIRIKNVTGAQKLLIKHVTKQRIKAVDDEIKDEIREFLVTDNNERKIILGKKLFRMAAKTAVEPIEPIYMKAWETGLLPRQLMIEPEGIDKGMTKTKAMPKDPHLFIARHIVPNQHVEARVIERLRQILHVNQAAYA